MRRMHLLPRNVRCICLIALFPYRSRKVCTPKVDEVTQDTSSNILKQRDLDTYIDLKNALQKRLFDVLLNWDLFASA